MSDTYFEEEGEDRGDRVRVFVTGSCEGLDGLRAALEAHDEVEFVGWSEQVRDGDREL